MRRSTRINQKVWFGLCLVTVSCSKAESGGEAPADSTHLFTLLPANATGVRFENRLRETNERNVFTYRNYYNGGGVGIGDLSGDSLPDLVLTANEDGPRVYLNRGQFRFDDVTRQAGVRTAAGQWTTG